MFLNRFFKVLGFLFVLIVPILLFLLPSVRNKLVSKSSDILSIFDHAISVPFSVVESKANDFMNISRTNQENVTLKERLYQNDIDRSKIKRLESENNELKDLLGLKDSVSVSKQIVGKIIDRSYSSWDREFMIDKGTLDGVSDSMFVLSAGGVIGLVEYSDKHSSRVKFLVDSDISSQHLTLKIEGKKETIFALLNGYDQKTGEFRLLQIGDPVEIQNGSLVSTSGLGKYKTVDLPVGTVTSIKKGSDQLGQEIRVKPKANFNISRYVLLIGE